MAAEVFLAAVIVAVTSKAIVAIQILYQLGVLRELHRSPSTSGS